MRSVTLAKSLVILLVVGSAIELMGPSTVRGAGSTCSTPYSAREALLYGVAETIKAQSTGYAENVKAQAMVLQAQSAMMKTQAECLKMRVEMLESYQKARGLRMDNDQKAAKNYYDRRQLRDTYKAAQPLKRYGNLAQVQQMLAPPAQAAAPVAAERPASSTAAHAAVAPAAPAKAAPAPAAPAVAVATPAAPVAANVQFASLQRAPVPRRPTERPTHVSGRLIVWPAIFNDPAFAESRARMDALFGSRTFTDVGPTTEFYHHVYRTASVMTALLQSKAHEVSSAESIAALRRLQSLVLEASRVPVHLGEIARN